MVQEKTVVLRQNNFFSAGTSALIKTLRHEKNEIMKT